MAVKVLASMAAITGLATSGVMFVQNLPITQTIAQKILDETEISLPNMTFGLCNNEHLYAINDVEIKVGGPPLFGIPITLQPYTQEIYTTVCDKEGELSGGWNCGDKAKLAKMGTYPSPEMHLHSGKNEKKFSVGMKLDSLEISTAGLIVPTFLEHKKAHLVLNAPDLALKFGLITITGLHMKDVYTTCTGVEIQDEMDVPAEVCGEPTRNQYYVMKCDGGKLPLSSGSKELKSWVADKIADFVVA